MMMLQRAPSLRRNGSIRKNVKPETYNMLDGLIERLSSEMDRPADGDTDTVVSPEPVSPSSALSPNIEHAPINLSGGPDDLASLLASQPRISGFLSKLSTSSDGAVLWKHRFFVLHRYEAVLSVFKSHMAPNASAISSLAVTSHTVSFDHGYGAWILIVMGAGRRWTLKCDDSAAANLWSDAIGTAINNSASTSSIFRAAAAPVRAATINNSSPTRENYAGSPTASSASTDADTSPRNQFARALNAQANTATRPPAITLAAPAAAPRRAPTAGTAEAGLFSSSNGRLQTAPTDAYALSAASTPPPPPPSANGRLQEWMTPAGTRSPPALAAAPAHAYADAFMSANGRLQHWPSSDSLSSSRGTTATAASPPMTRRDNHSNAGTPEYQAPGGGVSPLARTPSLRSRERPPRVVAGLDMLRTGSNRSAHSPFYGPDTDQSQQDTRAWR